MPIATLAVSPPRSWPLLVLGLALALLSPVVVAADRTDRAVSPQNHPSAQRLPSIRLHGNALKGAERNMQVDEIDRIALLVTWEILDPYKRTETRYTGIPLKDLVTALAPEASHVRMRAVNDYITVFERSDWESLPILLATREGDSRMTVANKGPARIVFLQTGKNEMAMQMHAPKWIWQVVDVEFQSR